MKQLKKAMFLLSLPFLMSVFLSTSAYADPGDPCTDPLDYCPIDGGLSALLVIGVGYGIKKVKDARKEQSTQELPE